MIKKIVLAGLFSLAFAISALASTTVSFYTKDKHGSIAGAIGANGNIPNTVLNQYSDYGINQSDLNNEGKISIAYDPYQYSGEYTDEESGLQPLGNGYRYYNPSLMRFISPDSYPLLNLYVYVNGNPIMNVDPTGHRFIFTGEGLEEDENLGGGIRKFFIRMLMEVSDSDTAGALLEVVLAMGAAVEPEIGILPDLEAEAIEEEVGQEVNALTETSHNSEEELSLENSGHTDSRAEFEIENQMNPQEDLSIDRSGNTTPREEVVTESENQSDEELINKEPEDQETPKDFVERFKKNPSQEGMEQFRREFSEKDSSFRLEVTQEYCQQADKMPGFYSGHTIPNEPEFLRTLGREMDAAKEHDPNIYAYYVIARLGYLESL